MSQEYIYVLKKPLARKNKASSAQEQYDKDSFESLEFREMTVDDMLDLDDAGEGTQHTIAMMALLSGKDKRVLRTMARTDFMRATSVMIESCSVENDES